jgi:hypothetical protein
MSDYRMNFGGTIGPSDTNKLYDMLNILGKEDELVISIDSSANEQTDTIFRVLEGNNFDIKTKGGHESGEYNIRARRKG